MSIRPLPGLALAALVLSSPRAMALEPEYWSKVSNNSGRTYTVTVTDTAKVMGDLYIRKAGIPGDGKKLGEKGASYSLEPGDYEFYFWTNHLGRIGIHLAFQDNARDGFRLHVTNLDPATPGTEFQISGDPLQNVKLLFDPTGYRNATGGTLLTLK